jgi:hypothetical protein
MKLLGLYTGLVVTALVVVACGVDGAGPIPIDAGTTDAEGESDAGATDVDGESDAGATDVDGESDAGTTDVDGESDAGTDLDGGSDAPPEVQTFRVGGTVSGLLGTGFVLQNELGDDLVVPAGAGAFTFATKVLGGDAYSVTVKTQPAVPNQVCTVTGGSGTVDDDDVTNVVVACTTPTFSIGGTISGLVGGVVLQNNGTDALPVAADGPFTFATKIGGGLTYAVTVLVPPPGQGCTITHGSGTVAAEDVTDVTLSCHPYTRIGSYTVDSGPFRPDNPPTYTCLEACSAIFGGPPATYGCSTVSTGVDHQAFVTSWGIAGCERVGEDVKKNASYDCHVQGCSQSALANDNCMGRNYCWK